MKPPTAVVLLKCGDDILITLKFRKLTKQVMQTSLKPIKDYCADLVQSAGWKSQCWRPDWVIHVITLLFAS